MSKKAFILIITALIAIGAAITALMYYNSLKPVAFTLKDPDLTVSVYRTSNDGKDETKVAAVSSSGTAHIAEGDYTVRPDGDTYDPSGISLSVRGNDTKITIDPDYSATHLSSLLTDTEKTALNTTISQSYPQIINQYTINTGQLTKKGEWYVTTLTEKVADNRDMPDTYRVVLHKENNTWKIIGAPALVLTTKNYKDVPVEVLKKANELPYQS